MSGGRVFAYGGIGVGLSVSVWANVAHAAARPAQLPAGQEWHPEPGSLAMAAFWPLGLFLALEILSRTRWSGGRAVVIARVGVGVVAGVAAVVSYLHLHGLLAHYGEGAVPALAGPLAIDGLMAVSAASLLSGKALDAAGGVVEVPVEVPASAPEPMSESPVAEPMSPAPVPPAQRELAPVVHRTRPAARRKPPARPVEISDDDLLAQVDTAVQAGELDAGSVTASRLRTVLGVGATRAGRLADAWHARHRLAVVPMLQSGGAR